METRGEAGAMLRTTAAVLLALVWLFPHLGALCSAIFPAQATPLVSPGVGVLDSNRTVLFALCFGAFVLSFPKRWRFSGAAWATTAFLFWTVLSSFAGGSPVDSLFFSQTWFAGALALVAGQRLLPAEFSPKLRGLLLHIPAIFICMVAVITLVNDPEMDRLTAPFGLANVYSNWMLMLLPFVLLDLLEDQGKIRLLAGVSSMFCFTTLALTYSRLGWLLTLVEICVVLLVVGKTPKPRLKLWGGGLFGGLALLVLLRGQLGGLGLLFAIIVLLALPPVVEVLAFKSSPKLLQRLLLVLLFTAGSVTLVGKMIPDYTLSNAATDRMEHLVKGDNSRLSRLDFWKAAVKLGNDHPMLGTGPKTFGIYYPRHQTRYYFYSDSPHNTTLELISDLGWAGGALFLTAFGALLWGARRNWRDDPYRKMAVVAVVFGLAQAQVDVTYQYASLWTTLALVCAVLTRREQEEEPFPAIGWTLVVALPILAFVGLTQRQFEIGRMMQNERAAFEVFAKVSDRLPSWSKPALKGLDAGLYVSSKPGSDLSLKRLSPLAARALRASPDNASSYRLAGHLAERENRIPDAERLLSRSLELDPFNFPSAYHALLLKTSNPGKLMERVLAIYTLEDLDSAYDSHRANLQRQLAPLFVDIADGMKPNEKPKETEPLYRFALDHLPKSHKAHFGLGVSLLSQQKIKEARVHIAEANRLFPLPYYQQVLDSLPSPR